MMKRIDPGTKPDRTCCAGKYGMILTVLAILVCFALISPVTAVSAEGGTVLPVDEADVIPVDTPVDITADAVMPPISGESAADEQVPPEDEPVISQEAMENEVFVANEAPQLQSVVAFSVAAPGSSSSINTGSIVISEDGEYTITGTGKKTTNNITVRSGTTATITLSGVIIDTSLYGNCAFSLEEGASVVLILAGDNSLKSGKNTSGLQVPTDTALEISAESTGSLTATGGEKAAGIGGGADSGSGEITINGGRVTAKGGADGAGIGGGSGGDAYRTFIHDGIVTATGGDNGGGAGIGSGENAETSGTILIDGGMVTATGGSTGGGAGIGGGYNTDASVIQIDGGTVFAYGAANTKEYSLSGAGIGGGLYGYGNSISITNGLITALGGTGRGDGDSSHAMGNGVQNKDVNLVLGIDEGAVIMTGYSAPGGTSDTYTGKRYARIYFNTLKPKVVEEPEPAVSSTPMSIASGDVLISGSGDYVISGTSRTNRVVISGEDTVATITLDGVNIDATATISGEKAAAFSVEKGATVNLILSGASILKGGENFAALQVTSDSTLIISKASTGSLTATGGENAAGIGGGFYAAGGRYHAVSWYDSGIIVINGGQVTAIGGTDGAGIGGAKFGSGGQITINDGMITATGGAGGAGAGIGSGFQGSVGGLFSINGGLVTATGGSTGGGAGIGGGAYSDAGTIQIDGGTVFANGAANTKEYSLSGAGIGGGLYGYGNSISITNGLITALGGTGRGDGDSSHAMGNGVQNKNVNLVLGIDEGAVIMTGYSAPGGTSDTYAGARYARIYFNTLKPKVVEEPESVGSADSQNIAERDVLITESGDYVISGTSKTNHVVVSGEDTVATITLDGVNIDATATISGEKAAAFSVEKGATVNLILSGANILKGGENFAALQVTSDATLIFSKASTGSLTATGGANAAGIGGGFYAAGGRYHGTSWHDSGIIVINGGQVTATGGTDGAGIGGAKYGSGGLITINDGMITATGGANGGGAGIGSGFQGSVSGIISITDGLVTATGGSTGGGAGIGGGAYSDAGTIRIDGGTVFANGAANTKEYSLSGAGIGGGLYGYGNSISITNGLITALGGTGRGDGDSSHAMGNGVQNQNVNLALAIDGNAVVMTGSSGTSFGTYDTYSGKRYARIYFNTLSPTIVPEPAVSGASSTYNVGSGNVVITGTGNYVITGTTNTNTITVKGAETVASITLDNVSIDATGIAAGAPAAALSLEDGAKVKLILKGSSTLSGGANYAALQVPEGTTLIVSLESTGSLTAAGGAGSAGIGGGFYAAGGHYYDAAWYDAGTIVINGGTVSATGGIDGAGIGGAKYGSGGQITLSAGTITATGGTNGGGSGVGSGFQGSVGGIVVINGGTVTATGSTDGAGIGGGAYSDAGTVQINGGLITSSGAKTEREYYYSGAGIGGGLYGCGNSIAVNGGQITATSGSGRNSNGDGHALGNGFKENTVRVNLLIDDKAVIKAGSKASSATATTYSGQPYASITLPDLPYTIPTDGTPVVTSISLSVPSVVSTGTSGTFTAEVKDQNGNSITGEALTWASSNTTVIEVNQNTGAYTAKADGTAVITATSVSKPSVKKTASVRVSSEPIIQVITSVEITGPSTAMIGSTGKLTGVVKDQDGNQMGAEKISWSSSNAAVLEVVAATGEYHAKAAGSVTITAAAMAKQEVNTTSTLTVSAPSGSYIAVDTSAYTKGIRAGEKVTVPVKVYGADNLAGFTIQVKPAVSGVVISPNSTRPSDLPGEIFSPSTVNNKVTWASTTPVSGTKTLFLIDVELQDESISTIPVEVSVEKLSDTDRNDVTAGYEVLTGMLHVAPPVVETANTITDGSWNAVTPAEIVYEVRPTDVAQVVAPKISSGFGKFYLSKGTAVIRYSDKPAESRIVTINPDGSVQIPGSLTNAMSIEITFAGEKLGDLDGSGDADIIDALAIVQSVGEMYTPEIQESFYGDVTKDDSLDIFDALAIVQYVGGMTDDNYNSV